MAPQVLVSPGAFVPFSGRGSSQECSDIALNWAIASNGLMEYTERYVLNGFYYQYGRFPYGVCAESGFRGPKGEMVTVDGESYLPEFAPVPRDSVIGKIL